MKNFKLTLTIMMIITAASCKKTPQRLSHPDLIGTWTQTKPYFPHDSIPYVYQFTADSIFVTSPYSTRGKYVLANSDSFIVVDCKISSGPGCTGIGSDRFYITGDASNIRIWHFMQIVSLNGPGYTFDLNMRKN